MFYNKLTVLVVEDNLGDFVLIKEYLQEIFANITIHHATTLAKAIVIVEEHIIDVILLDLTLPDGMGINTFISIRSKAEQIPVIILTGLEDSKIALESLHDGAQDYIVKDDCTPTLLAKSISYGIERSNINKQLKKSEEQYKYLFNNNPLPMIAYDTQSTAILMVNEAAVLYYGYSQAEFLQMQMTDLQYINKELIPEQSYKSNEQSKDLKQKKKNQELIDVEIHVHSITVEGKNATLAVIHDVTERNRAKEQMRQSEQNFRTISENFPNGAVSVLNKDLSIIYTAGKEFHIKNVPASFFINTNFIAHFQELEKKKISEMLNIVFSGETIVFEVKHEERTYIISGVPLYETNGSIQKILIASQNISLQKNNEKEKELLIEELTQINSDLRQFSYITSHNLRAPLSNLLGLLKLIDLNSIEDSITKLLLENFKECTLQLNDTVNDLINVLIIKNNVNLNKESLEIQKSFEKVSHSIKNHLDETETTFSIDLDCANTVNFNNTYLESILLNLLTNAVKYRSPERKPHISLFSEKINGGVKLYFRDNGLGIDLRRYKDRVFGLYQRFHNHADSKGLGLYIVKSQIGVMGGEIDVESEVDKGTTFIITFKN